MHENIIKFNVSHSAISSKNIFQKSTFSLKLRKINSPSLIMLCKMTTPVEHLQLSAPKKNAVKNILKYMIIHNNDTKDRRGRRDRRGWTAMSVASADTRADGRADGKTPCRGTWPCRRWEGLSRCCGRRLAREEVLAVSTYGDTYCRSRPQGMGSPLSWPR